MSARSLTWEGRRGRIRDLGRDPGKAKGICRSSGGASTGETGAVPRTVATQMTSIAKCRRKGWVQGFAVVLKGLRTKPNRTLGSSVSSGSPCDSVGFCIALPKPTSQARSGTPGLSERASSSHTRKRTRRRTFPLAAQRSLVHRGRGMHRLHPAVRIRTRGTLERTKGQRSCRSRGTPGALARRRNRKEQGTTPRQRVSSAVITAPEDE